MNSNLIEPSPFINDGFFLDAPGHINHKAREEADEAIHEVVLSQNADLLRDLVNRGLRIFN